MLKHFRGRVQKLVALEGVIGFFQSFHMAGRSHLASHSVSVYVLGLHDKVLVAGEATGASSVRSCLKLPPCATEANASQLQDRLLAKAKPITDSGSASGITYSRSGKKCSQREK